MALWAIKGRKIVSKYTIKVSQIVGQGSEFLGGFQPNLKIKRVNEPELLIIIKIILAGMLYTLSKIFP